MIDKQEALEAFVVELARLLQFNLPIRLEGCREISEKSRALLDAIEAEKKPKPPSIVERLRKIDQYNVCDSIRDLERLAERMRGPGTLLAMETARKWAHEIDGK